MLLLWVLRTIDMWVDTEFTAQIIGPIFKGHKMLVTKYHSTLRNREVLAFVKESNVKQVNVGKKQFKGQEVITF